MYAVAKWSTELDIKGEKMPLKRGEILDVITYGYHKIYKTKVQCRLRKGDIVFIASEGFRLNKFKIVTNIAIPKVWYKLLNSIKPNKLNG